MVAAYVDALPFCMGFESPFAAVVILLIHSYCCIDLVKNHYFLKGPSCLQ